jgi:phosphoenolpyruvate-protein phosphotransferase (PTS system enzyme I)
MVELQGIPVSPGVAIGPALVLDSDGYRIERSTIAPEKVGDEVDRLSNAVEMVTRSLEANQKGTSAIAGSATGDIFAAQLQMLHDPRLAKELSRRILEERQSAAYAVGRVLHQFATALEQLKNPLLAERSQDVFDIQRQLLTHLGAIDTKPLDHLTHEVVVVANNLTPSETANLDRRFVRGFCTESGGPGGHTAIVAKGLELPAVVGIGPFMDQVMPSSIIIVDGDEGKLIINPTPERLAKYHERIQQRQSLSVRLAELRDLPAETTDGTRIRLNANIEFPHETEACQARGADGIGLYRTEFLYLASDEKPSEEDHFQAYSQVIRAMKGRPVVIRTLDLGADKIAAGDILAEEEHNPFLGLRSIRLSLRNLDLFRPQLRAILRAAVDGDVRVMFPLVTTLAELRQARMMLKMVAEDLQTAGIQHRSDIPVGMMVEVPAAVMMLDHFVGEVDFLSIGTNDLAQYTLAVDRSNPYVADLYQSSDPAVLRLIERCIQIAQDASVSLAVCGEMSSRPALALLLVGMGVRNLSVPPSALPKVKKAIRSVSIAQCQQIAQRAMKFASARDIDIYLNDRIESLVPELILQ